MKSIAISIVIFKPNIKILISALESLTTAVDKLSVEESYEVLLIIFDNSVEDREENLEQLIKRVWSRPVKFIRSKKNLGFAIGHNQAIKLSRHEYHLILNPDVILDEHALVVALNYLQNHPQIVLVSPYACSEDGKRQYLCKLYPTVFDLFLRGFSPKWGQQFFARRLAEYELKGKTEKLELVTVPIVSGCFMLLRRQTFEAVGGFSEKFFLYFEDFDLSIKLQQLGDLAYVPDVKIIHFGGQAAKKGIRHIFLFIRSMCLFFNRHGWRWY